MFRFLRGIRANFIRENRFGQYLVYATGEIFLVVIGILIALQINNWNEDKKQNKAVLSALAEIRQDLVHDTLDLSESIRIRRNDLEAELRVIETLEAGAPFSDATYADLGHVMLFRPTTTLHNGFDILRELGLNNLEDRLLRNELVNYYEKDGAAIQKEIADDKFEFEQTWLPYVRSHFRIWNFGARAVPHSDEFVRQDLYLLGSLKINSHNLNSTLEAHQKALENARKLIGMLAPAPEATP